MAVGLIHLEDWGDDLDAWDIRFVNHNTVLHSEDLGTTVGLDAVDVTEVPSYQYLIFSRLSWRYSQTWLYPMNDVRRHEDAFYHYSGPACLVGFQGANNGAELRWRLDHREFADDSAVAVTDPVDAVKTYRVHRGTSPGQYTASFDPPAMTGDEGVFTDAALTPGTYYYMVESLAGGDAIPYSAEVSVVVVNGADPQPGVWLKSPTFIEMSGYHTMPPSNAFVADIRFGTANLPSGSDFELRVRRKSGTYEEPTPNDPAKVVSSLIHTNQTWTFDGTDVLFADFGGHLMDGTSSMPPITYGEILTTGPFPFTLVRYDGAEETEYPNVDLGGGVAEFSLSLNNRTITSSGDAFYSMKPGHPAWRSAVGNECVRIVTDGPDWNLNRVAYDGVFADVVERYFPKWVDISLPYDLDDATYGADMLGLCVAAKDAMTAAGGGELMANGFGYSIFTQEPKIDRVMCDGVIKVAAAPTIRLSFENRILNIRTVVTEAAQLQTPKPVHLKSHAGIVLEGDEPYLPIYREMEIAGYFLVMNPGATEQERTVMGYVGLGDSMAGRTMAFPESQLELGTPVAEPSMEQNGDVWSAVREFLDDEGFPSFVLYNYGRYQDPDGPGPEVIDGTATYRQVLSDHGHAAPGDWQRLVIDDDATTTEGGSFRFEPVDLDTEVLDLAEGAIIMQRPPVIPRILDDAYSPVWLSGGEPELEIKVLHPDTTTIESCVVSIHELKGLAEADAAWIFEITDDGQGADDISGDGVYTLDLATEISTMTPGEYEVWVYAEDDNGYYQYSRTRVSVVDDELAAKFGDYSAESDIGFTGTPYSSIAFDVNEDGFEDIVVTIQNQRSSSQVKYDTHQSGSPVYGDQINFDFQGSAFQTATDCRGLALGDYDNDGDDDLFAAHATALLLLENTGPKPFGQFVDASVSGLTAAITADSWAGAWGDYNADGWLDLYISRATQNALGKDFLGADPVSDRLMLGVDGASFMSSSWFGGVLSDEQPSFSATWCDVERDGDMDLFVPAANTAGTSAGARFYVSNGGSQFQDGLASWFPDAELGNSTSAAWADLDNDGDLDLVLSQLAGLSPGDPARPAIFLKDDGVDRFTQETSALPVVDLPTWDVRPMDFDLDGWTDLLLVPAKLDPADPDRAPKLYRNAGVDPLEYMDVSDVVFPASLASVINGVAPADYDLDGDLDLFLGRPTAGDEGFYYLSEPTGTQSHWLGVKLESSEDIVANRSGIGAQVMITDLGGDTILAGVRNYGGGVGRGGDASRGLRFGLGSAADSVVVKTHWLNGFVQRDTVTVDQIVTVLDGTPPSIEPGSVLVQCSVAPGQVLWGFEWDSEFLLADSVDQVILNGPSTNWANVTITPANATHAVNGESHALVGFATGCGKGLHTITVTMSSNGQTHSTVTTHSLRLCISGF